MLFPLYDIRLKLLLGMENVEVISLCREVKRNKWLEICQHQGNLLNDIAIVYTKIIMVGSNLSDDIIRELLREIQDIKLYVEDYLFKYAMEITVDEDMKEWIKAANKLSAEDEEDVSLLRRYMRKSGSDTIDLQEKLEKRILILEEFQEKSKELLELYRKEFNENEKNNKLIKK